MRYLMASVCAGAMTATSAAWAEPTGTLRQAHDLGWGAQSTMDPIARGRVFQVTEKVMSRLVRPDMEGRPQPDLAVSWEANDDATEWTLNLRAGVTFHDGSAFDADDVVYSLTRVLDPDLASPARSSVAMITSVEAIDPMTVRLGLDSPFADLPLQLMDYRLMMIPVGSGDTIGVTGIGTGPFRVESFDPDGTSVLVANMDYHEGPPRIARAEIIGISDAQARLQALLGGQIDIDGGVTSQQRVIFENSGQHDVQEVPTGSWRGMVFRTDVEPFTDERVRRAVRMVADREAMLALIEGGIGTVACDSPVGPGDQYYATLTCPQDIDGARALLAEAGFPDGLDIDIYVATLEPTWPLLAEVYQQHAAQAGIRVNIVLVPTDGYWSEVWMRRTVTMTRWAERQADQVMHEVYVSGAQWNESFFGDPDFDALLVAARRELDFDARRAIYIQAQEYLQATSGTLIPYHVTKLIGTTSRVGNLDAVENFAIRWHLVTVD